jgi:hypothetical protein
MEEWKTMVRIKTYQCKVTLPGTPLYHPLSVTRLAAATKNKDS